MGRSVGRLLVRSVGRSFERSAALAEGLWITVFLRVWVPVRDLGKCEQAPTPSLTSLVIVSYKSHANIAVCSLVCNSEAFGQCRRPDFLGFSKESLGIAYRFLLLLCRLFRFSAHFLRFLSLWTKNTNLLNSAFRRILFKLIACINYSVSFAQGTFAGRWDFNIFRTMFGNISANHFRKSTKSYSNHINVLVKY